MLLSKLFFSFALESLYTIREFLADNVAVLLRDLHRSHQTQHETILLKSILEA